MTTTTVTENGTAPETTSQTTPESFEYPSTSALRGDADSLEAYAGIVGGSILRLVGFDTDDGWIEAVDIGRPGEWQRITEGVGFGPTQKYNQLVEEISIHEADVDSEGEQ